MRKIEKRMWNKSGNPLWHVYQTVSFGKVLKNTVTIEIARYLPFFRMKNWLYRKVLKMTVGAQVTFAYKVMIDILFPEKISVGDNTIIGYQTTILAHEYLVNEYRVGTVQIGSNVMIGANCTIYQGLPLEMVRLLRQERLYIKMFLRMFLYLGSVWRSKDRLYRKSICV